MTEQSQYGFNGFSTPEEFAERVKEYFPGWIVTTDHASFAVEPKSQPPVPVEVASEVLHYFGYSGYHPGSFVTALLGAFARADVPNFAKLSRSFPDYGRAMALAKNDPDGIAKLKAYAAPKLEDR